MPSATTEGLRIATRNLRAGLARLLPESSLCVSLAPADLSSLRADLLYAADCWRRIAPASAADVDLKNAIAEYRSTVEQLARILPDVHGRLLAEKARLAMARAHVAATAAWAQASQTTL
jgi:predicted trehalose synthase